MKLSCSAVGISIIGFILFGKRVITLVYGTEFLGSYVVTIVLLFGALSMVFFKILGVVLLLKANDGSTSWFLR